MILNERRAIYSLTFIMACRMLGLFIILPIFSLYVTSIQGATPTLMGFALGAYGLTQACLQLPLGYLSDKIGRKKVITAGLVTFALGSLILALSHSIYGIIAGRAIQGAGAIGSTLLALAADLTPEENRSKAMASLGLAIGVSFAIAMILGPLLNYWVHLTGIFWIIFTLALLCLLLLHTLIPNPPQEIRGPLFSETETRSQSSLFNPQLLRLHFGIFSLHAILSATFIAAPILLTQMIKLSEFEQSMLYLIILCLAFILMLPFILVAEKNRKMKVIFIGAIIMICVCELLLTNYHSSLIFIGLILLLFFTAFTFLEASLPSLISKIAPIQRKGTAMGIYSTAQFFGIFIGSSLGGVIYSHYGVSGLFIFCTVIGLLWLGFAIFMQQPPYLSTFIFKLNRSAIERFELLQQKILSAPGVAEMAFTSEHDLIFIKADNKIINKDQLRNVIDESTL